MIELTCQTCGQKAGVQSFLAAAQQACARCGQLLMGPLDKGTRTAVPAGFAGQPPPPAPPACGTGSSAGLWLGAVVGVIAGIALVAALSASASSLPQSTRGAVLGALSGVTLAPVLALFTFVCMFLPWSLEGVLGDSLWTRISKALNHRQLRHLFLPFVIYVVLPMALCGFGGVRTRNVHSMLLSAGLGAALLGAMLGGICGSFAGRARQLG